MDDAFVVISDESVNTLLKDLESNIPHSIHALCFLKNLLKWRTVKQDLSSFILAPKGDFSECTFLIFFEMEMVFCTAFSLTEQGCIRLKDSLLATSLFPWSKEFLFTCIPDRIANVIRPVWEAKGIKVSENPGTVYWMPQKKVTSLDIPCPKDVYLTDLSTSDAEQIDSIWPHRCDNSVNFIREVLKLNVCLGLRNKETRELESWIMFWFYGGLGVLQTEERAKAKGYGSYVTASLCKRLVQEGWPIHLIVVDGNTAGHAFFNKLGFLKSFHNLWIGPSPS